MNTIAKSSSASDSHRRHHPNVGSPRGFAALKSVREVDKHYRVNSSSQSPRSCSSRHSVLFYKPIQARDVKRQLGEIQLGRYIGSAETLNQHERQSFHRHHYGSDEQKLGHPITMSREVWSQPQRKPRLRPSMSITPIGTKMMKTYFIPRL